MRWGMIGGGQGSQIGGVHRVGAQMDGLFTLAAGALTLIRSTAVRLAWNSD